MRDHVRILGILNIIMGCFTALIGVAVLIFLGGAGVLAGMAEYGGERFGGPFLTFIGVSVAVFFLLLALPSIVGGWGLLEFRPWARILMIVISILHLFNFPFGTALGVYGLWVLFSDAGKQLFGIPTQAYYAPAAYPVQPPQASPTPRTYPPAPPPGA